MKIPSRPELVLRVAPWIFLALAAAEITLGVLDDYENAPVLAAVYVVTSAVFTVQLRLRRMELAVLAVLEATRAAG